METPIILTAFGTSTKAQKTYKLIEQKVCSKFPNHPVLWSFSSRYLVAKSKGKLQNTLQVINQLHKNGVDKVIVQSLHLMAGMEFDTLEQSLKKSPIPVQIGRPLLDSDTDFAQVAQCIYTISISNPSTAVLLLGHGTTHPSWKTYPRLQKHVQEIMGERFFIGVVEKLPDSSHIPTQIAGKNFSHVQIIPFFLVNGMHFERDIIQCENSWVNRLERLNLTVDVNRMEMGVHEDIQDIFCRHIETVLL